MFTVGGLASGAKGIADVVKGTVPGAVSLVVVAMMVEVMIMSSDSADHSGKP